MSKFVSHIRNRLHKENRNFLCAVVGPTGSGKSWLALRLAEQVDKNFDIQQCVFNAKDFIALLKSGKLKRGSCVVFDEAGVNLNARNFQSQTNKALHYINQTFRSSNYAVIYTLPDFSFLDKGIRKLCHTLLQTVRLDRGRKICWVRPLMVENNAQTGKIYMKYPRWRDERHPRKKIVITKMYFNKPSEDLIEQYEAKKAEFNSRLLTDQSATLNEQPKPEPEDRASVEEIVQAVRVNPAEYRTKRGALNEGLIHTRFGAGNTKIRQVRQLLDIDGVLAISSNSKIKETIPQTQKLE